MCEKYREKELVCVRDRNILCVCELDSLCVKDSVCERERERKRERWCRRERNNVYVRVYG